MADKTLLILAKLSALSHLRERTDKNCLNCNAHVHGKFCHICGQENIEPTESAWHLITHFFNDITHFDGKFFSTLKLLITKPGFLSAEYKRGRRASYLNPVRMYVFTSFIFFVIFFWLYSPDQEGFSSTMVSGLSQSQIDKMDSAEFADFTKTLTRGKKTMSREEYVIYIDSVSKDPNTGFFGKRYKSRGEYDSLVKAGKVKENWLEKKLTAKNFEINEKYKTNREQVMGNLWDKLMHNFPQILFWSLPFFAVFLTLIYIRHKDFYFVSHGIYAVHLYIFYFIVFLVQIGLSSLENQVSWALLDWIEAILTLILFIYEYKAMRKFYGQGRFKTIIKFILVVTWRLIIFALLFAVFLFLSFLNV